MQIFLSYASEDYDVADQVHLALSASGHQVFFDRDSLPPGGDYHSRICSAVESSDIFVFLISPNSIKEGSYAKTELKYAREKWGHPRNRVLPVLLQEMDFDRIPAYLKAVTVLKPEGSVAAETLAAVSKMAQNSGEGASSTQSDGVGGSNFAPDAGLAKNQKVRIQVLVAVLGMIGALGAALISNWDNLFPPQVDVGSKDAQSDIWLCIDGVESYEYHDSSDVRIKAIVNGVEFVYPSVGGVEWLGIGPSMAGQVYRLPRTRDVYRVRFEAQTKWTNPEYDDYTEYSHFKSVKEVIIDPKEDVPFEERYLLYEFTPDEPETLNELMELAPGELEQIIVTGRRSATPALEVSYRLTHDPDD
jgi:hypothetical protein